MTKDYVTIIEEEFDLLGHKVKAVTERFSDEYLDSKRFEPRCLRCCFNNNISDFCNKIRCNSFSRDIQTHFELVEDESKRTN